MIGLSVENLILIIVAAINLALALVVYINRPDSIVNKSYALSVIFAGLWALGLALFGISITSETALFWARLYYIAAALIGAFFMRFGYAFPEHKSDMRTWWSTSLVLVPILPIVFFLYFTDWHIQKIVFTNSYRDVTLGPAYSFYGLVFLGYMSAAFWQLFKKFKKTSGLERLQFKYIMAGTLIAIVVGAFFNLLLPWLGNYQLIWLGPLATVAMVVLVAYAIFKHHLFSIKVVATEVFTGILLLLLFVNIFSSTTSTQYIFSTIIFLAAAGFGWLLIRSVLFEVSSREKIAKLAKQLQTVNDKLQQVDKVKTEFISIASHQLRTPLTIIKGYTSMALEGTFGRYTKQQHDVMDKLFQSANRLINLVEDLLNISRLEQGRIEYEYKVIDPVALVRGVVEELEPKAKKKGLRLIFIKPKHSVPHIRATSLIPIGIGGSGETFCFSL